eukprot:s2900_g10.t1
MFQTGHLLRWDRVWYGVKDLSKASQTTSDLRSIHFGARSRSASCTGHQESNVMQAERIFHARVEGRRPLSQNAVTSIKLVVNHCTIFAPQGVSIIFALECVSNNTPLTQLMTTRQLRAELL